MSRLIDADELVETLAVQIKANESDASASGVAAKEVLKGFIGLVNGQPTAQPKRMRGRWIKLGIEDPWYFVCSECRWKDDTEFNYCPNCGADMREGDT